MAVEGERLMCLKDCGSYVDREGDNYTMEKRDTLRYRIAPLEMTPSEFRKVGYQLIERIAEFLCTLPDRPVTPNESPRVIREVLGTGSLPEHGTEARNLLEEAADLLFDHSTFN